MRVQRGDASHRGHDLGQARRVEQLAVQVMARAVIAQVQAEHREAAREQVSRGAQQVRGVRGAVPAVDQYREAALGARMRGIHPVQADALAAVEEFLARRGLQRVCPARGQRTARTRAREEGLQVRVAEPPRRSELRWRLVAAYGLRDSHGCGASGATGLTSVSVPARARRCRRCARGSTWCGASCATRRPRVATCRGIRRASRR